MRLKDGWHKFPVSFEAACHLVVSACFKRFGETVGSCRQNLQRKKKKKAFPKLKSATTVIGFFILILN